jgi:hypothetical protein
VRSLLPRTLPTTALGLLKTKQEVPEALPHHLSGAIRAAQK